MIFAINCEICRMQKITFSDIENLLKADRSVRRFDASRHISLDALERIVGLTRYCASARNLQPLRYMAISETEDCDALFPLLSWAGYYEWWPGPDIDQRPTGYIIQCLDTSLTANPMCDDGLHLQAMTMGATAWGMGCCIIKAFNATKLKELFKLPDYIEPRYVLAVGYPAEKTAIVEMGAYGNYKYYRDKDDTQCVPKRSLEEILLK